MRPAMPATCTTRTSASSASWNHIFGPQLINQLRVQVVPYNNVNEPSLAPGTHATVHRQPRDFQPQLSVSLQSSQERYQFEDNLTWLKGNHTFKFGGSYRPVNFTVQNDLWFGGEFDFYDGTLPLIAIVPASSQAALAGFNLTHGYPANGPANTYLTALESYRL